MLTTAPGVGRRACPMQDITGLRMGQAQRARMQQQTMLGSLPVERVAQDGMTQVCHVHAQLMCAPTQWLQFNTGGGRAGVVSHSAPQGAAGLAALMSLGYFAFRTLRPIKPNGRIDALPIRVNGQEALNPGQVAFAHLL